MNHRLTESGLGGELGIDMYGVVVSRYVGKHLYVFRRYDAFYGEGISDLK